MGESVCPSVCQPCLLTVGVRVRLSVCQAELDLTDSQDQLAELQANYTAATIAKRKLEGEVQSLHTDLDDMLNEAKSSEEKAKKAMVDAAR